MPLLGWQGGKMPCRSLGGWGGGGDRHSWKWLMHRPCKKSFWFWKCQIPYSWYFHLNTHRNFSDTWTSRRQLKTHLKNIRSFFLSFKWWPCGTSWKLQLFHNMQCKCSCCRKFGPTFALFWVMSGLNKACPGHWQFSPFYRLIKWQGNRTLAIRLCYYKPTRFVPEQTRATAKYRLKSAFTGY